MRRDEAAVFLERLSALIPAYAPDMAHELTAGRLIHLWWNGTLNAVAFDEAEIIAADLASHWNLPRWPKPADFTAALRRRRTRAAKDSAIAAARAAINAAPPSVLAKPNPISARRPTTT